MGTVPVRYVGPFDAVDVYPTDTLVATLGARVERAATIEVAESLAASLLLQPENWQAADEVGERIVLDLLALNGVEPSAPKAGRKTTTKTDATELTDGR